MTFRTVAREKRGGEPLKEKSYGKVRRQAGEDVGYLGQEEMVSEEYHLSRSL